MPHGEQYKCDISLKGKHLGTQYISAPAHLTHPIDSAMAYDAAAYAAVSFATDEADRGKGSWGDLSTAVDWDGDGGFCISGHPHGYRRYR